MGSLGGNSIHAATAAFVNGVTPRIVARQGDDFPADALDAMRAAGITTEYLIPITGPTVRNWVIYEWNGNRTWVYRTPKERSAQVAPMPQDIPESAMMGIDVVHVAAMPLPNASALVKHLRATAPQVRIVLDTHEDWVDGYQVDLLNLASQVDYFLPSKEELVIVMSCSDLDTALVEVAKQPIKNIVVKAGNQGAFYIHDDGMDHIPAQEANVKDTTGAGDVFCGAFAAGIALGKSTLESVMMGVKTAATAIENSGSLRLIDTQHNS